MVRSASLIDRLPRKLQSATEAALAPGEQVRVQLKGWVGQALVCTDRRVLIIKTGWLTDNLFGHGVFQLPYSAITSVEVKWSLTVGYFELSAGGVQTGRKSIAAGTFSQSPTISPNCVSIHRKADVNRFREACAIILEQAASGSKPDSKSSSSSDVVDALERLAELHRTGTLDGQEFAAQKARLLRG